MKTIILEVEVIDNEVVILKQRLEETEVQMNATEEAGGGITTQVKRIGPAATRAGASMKAALIATGIGVFIVALGFVIAHWDDIKEAIWGADDALKDFNVTAAETIGLFDLLAGNLLTAFEFDGLVDSTKDLKTLRNEFKGLDAAITRLEESGTDTQENIEELIKKYRELIVVQNDIKDVTEKLKELDSDDKDFQVQKTKLEQKLGLLFREKTVLAEIFKIEKERKRIENQEREVAESVGDAGLTSEGIVELNNEKLLQDSLTDAMKQGLSDRLFEQAKTNQLELDAAAKIAGAKLALQLQFVQNIGNALGAISDLFERGTAASKINALAEIAIGTGVGFINALTIAQDQSKAGGPFTAFAFPVFYAAQIAAVLGAAAQAKRILSTVKGGGGISFGGGSLPGLGEGANIPQIDFNVVGDTGQNQILDTLRSELSIKPMRSYVVFGDIKKAGDIDRESIRESTV